MPVLAMRAIRAKPHVMPAIQIKKGTQFRLKLESTLLQLVHGRLNWSLDVMSCHKAHQMI
jgi:hypothetical protein